MKPSFKKSFLFILTLVALIISAVGVTPAFADEATPPPPTEEPALPPTEEPVATVDPAATPTEEPTTVEQVVDQLPADTTVVVLDASGETVPLASQDAASVFVTGDPMWCPEVSGVQALPGDAGCTPGQSSFNDLIDLLKVDTSYSGSGTIYVAWDYDASDPNAAHTDTGKGIIFNYDDVELTNLTLQGGWDFSNNWIVTDRTTLAGVSSLQFWNWGGNGSPASLTINDLIMNGGQLYVQSSDGNVELNNVSVVNGSGASIDAYGDITVTNSSFDDNTGSSDGIRAYTHGGDIIFDNVTASGNASAYGATLQASSICGYDANWTPIPCPEVGDIFVTNSRFDQNRDGLQAYTEGGDLILDGVTANGNTLSGWWWWGGSGAQLSANSYWCGRDANGIDTYCASGSIFVTDSNFENNNRYGLNANTNGGDLVLDQVTASGNTNGNGAQLGASSYWCGRDANGIDIFCSSGSLFVTNSSFDSNSYGLSAYTDGGDIDLTEVTANGNTNGAGADLSASYYHCGYDADWKPIYCSSGGVFVTNGTFNNNAYTGLNAYTYGGDITLDQVTANGTTYGDGANLNADFQLCGYDANWNPIYCSSGGDIFITKSTFSDNAGNGAYLNTPGDASVECSEFNSNGSGGAVKSKSGGSNGYGLNAESVEGSLNLDSVTFDGLNAAGDYSYNGTATVSSVDCNPVPPSVNPPASESLVDDEPSTGDKDPLYAIIAQTEDQLPGSLGQEAAFGSAVKLVFTGQAEKAPSGVVITLSFPIPESMKDATLAVMFWDGSQWMAVPGGSVVDGFFVITVTTPGTYVLVSR